jgi:two-component system, OmpR family, response regulator
MDTVLIVDDDPAIREIFSAYLGMGGYRILEAAGGPSCLELLKVHTPDIILLDMMMEPMDGWETLLAIRHNAPSSHIPVIIITGKPPVPEDILKYGGLIENFVVKPIDFNKIVQSLQGIIAGDRDLARETERLKEWGESPESLDEYHYLLRLVRVAHNLELRFRGRPWTENFSLSVPVERLHVLHKRLGFPDRLLEPGSGAIRESR